VHLDGLEARSITIIREAYATLKPMAALWSVGKDSGVLLWLVKKAFFGRVPFPVILLDTGMELDEVYAFRDHMIREWNLDCINHDCPPLEDMDADLPPATRAAMRKTEGLKSLLADGDYKALLLGIRRDEQGLRAKERVFSPRHADGSWNFKDQPAEMWGHYGARLEEGAHMRVHPLLEWSELDIWRYIARENIPVCDLYFARDGRRYRSLGEKNITAPIESNAANIAAIITELEATRTEERAGRAMDHESEEAFEVLRTAGYM